MIHGKSIIRRSFHIGDSLDNIGICYGDIGDHRKAIEYYISNIVFNSFLMIYVKRL